MKKFAIRNIFLFISIIGMLILYACLKEPELEPAPRIFRPISEVDNTIDNTLIVYFKAIQGAELYTAEISRDTFQTIDQSLTIDPDTASPYIADGTIYTKIVFNDLLAATYYGIRVKAVHADTSMNSEWSVFFAETYNIFINPPTNEILDYAFKARWDQRGALLSRMVIQDALTDSLVLDLTVSLIDNRDGVKIVDGLVGSTQYSVFLYSGETLRGRGTVTTQEAIEGDPIIDLRTIDNPEVLYDTISDVPSGSTILLKRGMTYDFPGAAEISGSVILRSGYDFVPDLALLDMNGNPFQVANDRNIDEIVFRDLSIISTYGGNSYVMFLDTTNIGRVEFENVNSHGHRGFFRVTSQGVIDNLTINNCVIDSLREYGITHISGDNASIGSTTISNSTFYYVARPFYCTSEAVNESNSLILENVTFYDSPDAGRHFFDYNRPAKATMSNCVVGKWRSMFGGTALPRGYRPYEVTPDGITYPIDLTIQLSYQTNDFVTENNPANQSIALDLIPYNGSSFDLFADPEQHDFTIIDGGFSGASSAGDPRWW